MSQRMLSVLIILLSLYVVNSHAEIYRFQDAKGKWHFTDSPPDKDKNAQQLKVKNIGTASESDDKKVERDLQRYLSDLIQPNNEIEKATMAVVKIETITGSGSGFFVSEEGHIITNKHVVRLTATKYWKSEQQKIQVREQQIKETKDYLQQKKLEMSQYKKELADYKKKIINADDAQQQVMQQSYRYYLKRYDKQKKAYKTLSVNYEKAKTALSKHKWNMRLSRTANTFKIILKENTELQARLVKLSPNFDLALLQLSGNYKTPFLKNTSHFTQGMDVYAIGSPLGFKDYVSKGVIMGQERGHIVTDTQILSGNSGGPLITATGDVIGVNTAVYRAGETVGSEVFGYVIPTSIVKKEFASELQSIETVKISLYE